MLDADRNTLFEQARTYTLVDNDAKSRFGYVEDNTRLAMIKLVWHSLVDGTIGLDVNIVTHFVWDHVCRKVYRSSVLAEATGKHVTRARSISVGVRHGKWRKFFGKFRVIASCIPLQYFATFFLFYYMTIRAYSKTYSVPRRPYEKARLDAELQLAGRYGLRNKREIWRVSYMLAKIRKAARELLTLEERSPRRLFEGNALIRRLMRIGVLDKSKAKLDYVLALKVEDFLERRLQTIIWKAKLAKSIHHARVLIRQRHIRVGGQIVDVPSFTVRLDAERHIDFAATSPYAGGRPGRVKRRRERETAKGAGSADMVEDDE